MKALMIYISKESITALSAKSKILTITDRNIQKKLKIGVGHILVTIYNIHE